MSNSISQPNFNNPSEPRDVWTFPITAENTVETNPAAIAREEYAQHQYAESLATPDYTEAVENAAAEVDSAYADGVYADRDGNAIDPAHAEDALRQAANVVDAREQHEAAVGQSQIYARRIMLMRQGASANWGAESLN
jgi:hypothetical protein